MCTQGTSERLTLRIPAAISRTGAERDKVVDVDACIAPLVSALNAAGLVTIASCCGHWVRPGNIALADGRELIVAPDYGTARLVDAAFPPINPPPEPCAPCAPQPEVAP